MQSQDARNERAAIADLADTLLCIVQSRHASATGQILARNKAEWLTVPAICRPWGFWIREYDPLPVAADDVDQKKVPQRVWFYDNAGLRSENVWKWMRFVAVRTLAPSTQSADNFPFGMTAFAPYEDSDDYYLDVLWAGKYGTGWRVTPGREGRIITKKELWIA